MYSMKNMQISKAKTALKAFARISKASLAVGSVMKLSFSQFSNMGKPSIK